MVKNLYFSNRKEYYRRKRISQSLRARYTRTRISRTAVRIAPKSRHLYFTDRKAYYRNKRILEAQQKQEIKRYRFSYAINFPIHQQYWGCLGQVWSDKVKPELEQEIAKLTQEFLLNYLNYDVNDLWFDLSETVVAGSGWQEVTDDIEQGVYEIRIENDSGATESSTSGRI